jgi:hypothetical protein
VLNPGWLGVGENKGVLKAENIAFALLSLLTKSDVASFFEKLQKNLPKKDGPLDVVGRGGKKCALA